MRWPGLAGDGDGVADGDGGEEGAVGEDFEDLASGEGGEGEGADDLLDAHLVAAGGAEILGFDDGEGAEGVAGHDPVAVGELLWFWGLPPRGRHHSRHSVRSDPGASTIPSSRNPIFSNKRL